jgi:hypothetical protein
LSRASKTTSRSGKRRTNQAHFPDTPDNHEEEGLGVPPFVNQSSIGRLNM